MCSGSHSSHAPGGNSDETNITSRRKIATLSSREHGERDGSESGGGWGLWCARETRARSGASPAGLSVPSARRADRGIGARRLELVEHLAVGERDELGHVAVRAER